MEGLEWQADDLKLAFLPGVIPRLTFLNVIEQHNQGRIRKKLLLTQLEMSGSCQMFDLFLNIHFHALEIWWQEFWTSTFMTLPNWNSSGANALGKLHAKREFKTFLREWKSAM